MQTVSEMMTRDVRFVAPQENLQRAAQLMDELNVGALPVCDGERLVGMVTDRDITIRATAAGRSPQQTHVDEIMSTDVRWCFEDQPMGEVMIQMADSQLRRIPVVSHDEQHKLVGIVSLGDVVTRSSAGSQKDDAERVVEKVSSPSSPSHAQAAADSQEGRGSPRNAPVPTSSYAAGSEGLDGTEEWGAPTTSSTGNAAERSNESAGAGKVGGTAAAVAAAGGTDAAAGARMAGGPATHTGGAPGGAATAGTTEPLSNTAAGGGSPAAGAAAAGGTGLGDANMNAGAGDTRIVPESPNTAASGTSTPGGKGVSAGRNPG